MFKKLVLANNLLLFIQPAYIKPLSVSGFAWVLVSIISRFYIYYDFAGYSDISNGVSLLFGIKVPKNFDLPFKSKSITEFWRRWHISLSSWIRDYVYYPLVSKFSNYAGIYISLIISFICLGLWHGDQINYLLYGLINGVAVAGSTYFTKKNRNTIAPSKFKLLFSRFNLYLFLVFLPSILLMAHGSTNLFQIVKSFAYFKSWFSLYYFSIQNIIDVVYLVIPLFLCFELLSTLYGENLKKRFFMMKNTYRLIWLLTGIFITFTLTSPAINYRFLYQVF
jgi:alginate O-acetyltransferase complex protein AlgI